MKATYLVIDACQFSANYNFCLLHGLAQNNEHIVYATTNFPYEELPNPQGVHVKRCFFFMARAARKVTSSGMVRRMLRAVEYPFDWLFLLFYILVKRIKTVHLMWVVSPTIDLYIVKALQMLGCKVVYTAHNPFPHEFKEKHLQQFMLLYKQADHIIALTEFSKQEIIKRAGISTDKISVIPHGDYDPLFAISPTNESLIEEIRKQAAGRKIVSFIGGIRPYKGLTYFILAFRQIKNKNPNTFFLIAGSMLFGDNAYYEKLFAENCSPTDYRADIRYLPLADLKAYVAVTDVLVQPYITASQSGNTAMAYAAGIPVVSTNVGGLGEMVEDGITGVITSPKDPSAIAEAVCRCLAGNNRQIMGTAAYKMVRERYSWSIIAEQTADVYRQV